MHFTMNSILKNLYFSNLRKAGEAQFIVAACFL